MPNWKKVIVSGSNASLSSVTASSAVSASGDLFANLAETNDSNFKTVVYDTSTGQFHRTGSYGGGGSGKYESGTGTGGIKPTEGSNTNSGQYSTVAGGKSNSISGTQGYALTGSFIGAGTGNTISYSACSNILGGQNNILSGSYDGAIEGGGLSQIKWSSILGGCGNSITGSSNSGGITEGNNGCFHTIAGGEKNSIFKNGKHNFIGGGRCNRIEVGSGYGCNNIIGGYNNIIKCGYNQSIVGGYRNCIENGYNSFIGGGYINKIKGGSGAKTVVGGSYNTVSGRYATIAGGIGNYISSYGGVLIGGNSNRAEGSYDTISGGCKNKTNGQGSVIAGGKKNTVFSNNVNDSSNSILGGYCNSIISGSEIIGGTHTANSILGGCFNFVSASLINGESTPDNVRNNIIAGSNNKIHNASSSAILGGESNYITHNNSFAIGSSITSSAADTLFVNSICLYGTTGNNGQILGGANITLQKGTFGTGTTIIDDNISSSGYIQADSYIQTDSSITASGDISSSATIQGNHLRSNSLTSGNVVLAGTSGRLEDTTDFTYNTTTKTITAGTGSFAHLIVEEVISSSVINATGSNTLGDASNDTQTLRGTVVIPDTATGASETTALFINASNQINKRALQSNAFTSTSIPTAASDIGALAVDNNLSDLETVSTARTNLGLGSFATLNSLAFASLTSKPTTIAGYGITDALQIGTTATTALAGNTTVGTVVTGNGGGTGDTLSSISIGGTNFTVATGTGDGSVTSVGTTGTVNGITLTGTVTSAGSLTLGGTLAISNADWSGTDLSVSNGGTGLSSLTSTYIPYGNGTSAFGSNAALAFNETNKQLILTGINSAGNSPLSLVNLQEGGETDVDTLILDSSNHVVKKTLGTNAFSSTTIPTNNNQLSNGAGYITSVGTINLASGVTGTLPVGNGGTGVTSLDSIGLSSFDNDSNFYAANDTLRAANGTNTAPGLSFNNDTNTGFYSSNPDELSISIGGSRIGYFNSNGLQVTVSGQTSQFSGHLQAHCLGIGTSPSAVSGEIRAAGDVTANYSSDKRLKKNIKSISGALDKLSTINGVEFDWIEKEGVHSHKGHDVGVIAQEVEKVLPEVVVTRDNGYKAVNYEKIIPLLIESIKDLKAEIDELKKSK